LRKLRGPWVLRASKGLNIAVSTPAVFNCLKHERGNWMAPTPSMSNLTCTPERARSIMRRMASRPNGSLPRI
jgi:hypothetical protein